MDPIGLRALNPRCYPGYLLIRPRPRTIRPACVVSDTAGNINKPSPAPKPYRASSSSASYSVGGGDSNSCPNGSSSSVSEAQCAKLLQVVLVSPQIPGNTGSIARTCAASAVGLHLVGDGDKRLLAFTKRGSSIHSDFSYRRGDWLVFGSETRGLPPEALEHCCSKELGGGTIRIPMVETYVRCLNLSVSVGVALYEAARQLNYEQLRLPPEAEAESQRLFLSEDIYG